MEQFKPLPQSIEVEQNLLGCLINYPNCLADILGIITHEDFYKEAHKIIYSVLINLFTEDKKIDLITIINEIRSIKALDNIGGITYISEIAAGSIGKNAKAYADIIKELSNKRKLIKTGIKLTEEGYNEKSKSKDILNTIEDELFKINIAQENRLAKANVLLESTLTKIEQLYINGGGMTGLETKFHEIDRITRGLQRQDLIILAARPSMGKTTIAMNIGSNVAKEHNVAIFSLEMSKEQLMTKIIASESIVKYENVRSGKLTDDEWRNIANASNKISQKNLFIDDRSALSVNEIKATCKKIKMQHGLDLVIIDYLQLMTGKGNSREQEISGISQGLKGIAKELDCTVIALSQLSRAPEQRADHRPILSDLRESGGIEQDADIVMFLYRDEYYNKRTVDKNISECIFSKNRNGKVGTVKLGWFGEYQKFGNLE
jgi:replicative DNA helicase